MEKLKKEISERVTSKLLDITGLESSLKVEIKPLRVEEGVAVICDDVHFCGKSKTCSVEEAEYLQVEMNLFINNVCECIVGDRFQINDNNIVKKAAKLVLDAFLSEWGE